MVLILVGLAGLLAALQGAEEAELSSRQGDSRRSSGGPDLDQRVALQLGLPRQLTLGALQRGDRSLQGVDGSADVRLLCHVGAVFVAAHLLVVLDAGLEESD